MRKVYWYASAYIKKHGLLFLFSIILAVIVFSVFIPQITSLIEKRDREYIGLVGEYTLQNLPQQIKQQVSAGLTKVNEDGSLTPLLSERWTVEQEGKTYRFLIKKGVYWQDGKEVFPQDIHYLFNDVETITTPNDIVFKLPDAYAPFPTVVSEPLIRTEKERRFFFFSRTKLIGIGENKITSHKTKGQKLSELTVEGNNKKYVYRFYLTENDAVMAYKRGEVDNLPELSRTYDIMNWPTTTTTVMQGTDRYLAVFFNIRNGLFQKNVRQALSYATKIPDTKVPAYGPINPKSWAYLEGSKRYDFDLERASQRLMDEMPGEKLTFELTTTTEFETVAEEIKSQWEEFGQYAFDKCQANKDVKDKNMCENLKIGVSVKVTNFPDTNNFQLMLLGQEIPSDPDQYDLWHSDRQTNFTGYKNTRIDNLLEKGRKTFSQQERKEIYQEFQQFFSEDAPAIFLYYLENYEVTRD